MQKSISTSAYQKLVDWLRESRESKGLSMRDLGDRIGEPHSFIQKVESMERRIDVYELVQYCKALDQDPYIAIRIVVDAS